MPSRKLYDWLEHNYDRLIQWDNRIPRELPGLLVSLPDPNAGSLLDLGCGTGGHLRPLIERGYHCYGIDLSEKLIAIAQSKLPSISTQLIAGSMIDGVPNQWPKFAAQICLGNTLSHLTEYQLPIFLENAYQRSLPGGRLIIENRNWDRILREKDRFLKPVIYSDSLFIRLLDFPEDAANPVVMTVALWQDQVWSSSKVHLYPYTHSQLIAYFEANHWKFVGEMGNLAGSDYNEQHSSDWVSIWQK